jgi:hypothetical protein
MTETVLDPTAMAHLKASALVQLAKTHAERRSWEVQREQLQEQMRAQQGEEQAAAMRIQRVARGRSDRKRVQRMKQEKAAAECIQRHARAHMGRKREGEVERLLDEEKVRAERAAVEVQRHVRGSQARKTVEAERQQRRTHAEAQLKVVHHRANQVMVRESSPFWKTRRAHLRGGLLPARLTGLSALGSSSTWKKPVVATETPDSMQPVGSGRGMSLMDEIMEAAEVARMRSGRRAMPRVPHHDPQPLKQLQLSSLGRVGPPPRPRKSVPPAREPPATQWHKEVFRSLDSLQSYANTALQKVLQRHARRCSTAALLFFETLLKTLLNLKDPR